MTITINVQLVFSIFCGAHGRPTMLQRPDRYAYNPPRLRLSRLIDTSDCGTALARAGRPKTALESPSCLPSQRSAIFDIGLVVERNVFSMDNLSLVNSSISARFGLSLEAGSNKSEGKDRKETRTPAIIDRRHGSKGCCTVPSNPYSDIIFFSR